MVGVARGAQPGTEPGVGGALDERLVLGRGQAEVDDVETAAELRGGREEVSGAGAGEGDGAVRGEDGPGQGAVVDAGPGGEVDRQDAEGALSPLPRVDEGSHERRRERSERAGGADAREAVDDEVGAVSEGGGVLRGVLLAHREELDARRSGTLESGRVRVLRRQERGDAAAARSQPGSGEEGVTPVVTAPDEEEDAGAADGAASEPELLGGREREGVGSRLHVVVGATGEGRLGTSDGAGAVGAVGLEGSGLGHGRGHGRHVSIIARPAAHRAAAGHG